MDHFSLLLNQRQSHFPEAIFTVEIYTSSAYTQMKQTPLSMK